MSNYKVNYNYAQASQPRQIATASSAKQYAVANGHGHRQLPVVVNSSNSTTYSLPSYMTPPSGQYKQPTGVHPAQAPHPHTYAYQHSQGSPAVSASDSISIRSTSNSLYNAPPSLTATSLSSSGYSGSVSDNDREEEELDMVNILADRLVTAFDPIQLDRSLAVQAQSSGMLNSKTRELIALQEEAAARLASTKRNLADGMRAAREVKKDLEWCHTHVRALKIRTEQKYAAEYALAQQRVPAFPYGET